MAFVSEEKQEINFKIVYHGPGLAGKTTNIQYIYNKMSPAAKGKMVSLASETDRTLLFDFVPLSLGKIRGMSPRFYLYTTPGPVFYDKSRQLVLKGVDGVIFVADSQEARAEANVESLEQLETNLALHGYGMDTVPLVLQYNKRDLPEILPVEALDEMLNPAGRPRFEGIAHTGVGVFDTLRAVALQVIDKARG